MTKWLDKLKRKYRLFRQNIRDVFEAPNLIRECQQKIHKLELELFQIPQLPPMQVLPNLLGNRLEFVRKEMDQFLGDEAEISDSEHRYLLLQEFFRGSEARIREELAAVLKTVVVEDKIRSLPVWDIGCGRGELLGILSQTGFNAVGVDTSSLMVDKLRTRGLDVYHGDAVKELSLLENDALCGVTAFHVVEHLPHEYLLKLLQVAYEKLAPGGFMLLETPNPYCFESFSFFYTDNTHVRPIQPYQLAFLVETAGFTKTGSHFTAPVPAIRRESNENWMRLYQNHGIVGYKPIAEESRESVGIRKAG